MFVPREQAPFLSRSGVSLVSRWCPTALPFSGLWFLLGESSHWFLFSFTGRAKPLRDSPRRRRSRLEPTNDDVNAFPQIDELSPLEASQRIAEMYRELLSHGRVSSRSRLYGTVKMDSSEFISYQVVSWFHSASLLVLVMVEVYTYQLTWWNSVCS
ncbi:hypothetical protein BJ170DRAFT_3430 [Xylariales sp. AK1849]|nr:hypothetical protein BJ170DRAFT_3430 [Xylariales sp. AK1849]